MPPPLLGFNNNVRHKGKIFHIQTEDSGVKHPRIVTHLFADGGRIVKTTRTDYAEHVGRDDMVDVVRSMMKEQHKAMFISLRAGELDPLLEPGAQPAETRSSAPVPDRPRGDAVSSAPRAVPQRPLSNPNLRKMSPSVVPPGPDDIDLDVGSLDQYRESLGATGQGGQLGSRRPSKQPASRARDASESGRYAASRPAAIFGEAPSRDNLFGDSVISEQSLDEVILSYLAEDLEGSQE